jgi:hypothetical protein
MTNANFAWAKAIAGIIQTTEEAADELVQLAAQAEDAALTAGLHEMVRHRRIQILKMQCQLAELCGGFAESY